MSKYELNDMIQQSKEILNQSTGTAFLIAQGVLSSYYNGSLNTCIGETADSLKHTVFNSEYDLINTELLITVKPNPAGDWAAVDYSFPTTFDKALLSITDITGRIIYTATLDNIRGQKLIDLRQFSAGTYMITIKAGSVKKTVKFVKING